MQKEYGRAEPATRPCPSCGSPLYYKLNADLCTNEACKYIYFWRY